MNALFKCLAKVAFLSLGAYPALATPASDNGCLQCHEDRQAGFGSSHAFGAQACVTCHQGDEQASAFAQAHGGLIAFPGNLDNAAQSCGACHADMVTAIESSLMHTGAGIVRTTRHVIDGDMGSHATQNLQSLSDSVADSLLRKQCASCHLGQAKTAHGVNPTTDRGGGCLACHVGEHPEKGHVRLSAEVSVGRCFGCHSRSSRISLSFTGLAEVDGGPLKLADRRSVEKMPADHHYLAGMTCVDCHGSDDLKKHPEGALHKRDAVAAACTDCHEPHRGDERHERLSCSSCHSQWAPQCYGCHIEFDESGEQWDHVDRQMTPGQWHDQRWNVRNVLPPLGVDRRNRVVPFVPGMVMTIDHPDWESQQLFRLFAPLAPHTTGASRSCESCHRSSEALGLGRGELKLDDGGLHFTPSLELLEDGLPADAWTNPDNTLGGRAPLPGQRPFTEREMLRIFGAELQQDSLPTGGKGKASRSSSSSYTGGTNSTSGRAAELSPLSPTK